ncbi:MAG TPA: drug/metabolite exporter YedA [Candidatus Bathyarchaeia archaeon]|nr:drug/metabolite exporter YedA [Candidatus Bathyarchaeia archaeon]
MSNGRSTANLARKRVALAIDRIAEPSGLAKTPSTAAVLVALLAVYTIWGSTYFAIQVALESLPPFLTAGTRFLVAGGILFAGLRLSGALAPSRLEWRNAAAIGALMLVGGNGGVVYAEQHVASSIAALAVATSPLWVVLFTGFAEGWPHRAEWAGLAIGFAGVVLLNLGGDLRANPQGAVALLISQITWSLGATLNRRLALPAGLMAAAAEMLAGGVILAVLGLLLDAPSAVPPSARSLAALAYLIAFGSIIGFSAFNYLIRNVRPAVATSNAYVNPVVAVLIGVGLGGERIGPLGGAAMATILTGVLLVVLARQDALD